MNKATSSTKRFGIREEPARRVSAVYFLLLLLYTATVLIRPQEYVDFLDGVPLALLIELVLLLAWLGSEKRMDSPQYWQIAALAFIVLLSTVSVSGSIALEETQLFIAGIVLLFYFVSDGLPSLKHHRAFIWLLIIGALIMALHGIDQFYDPDKQGWTGVYALFRKDGIETWQIRYIGIFEDPNDLGLVLVGVLPFLVLFYYEGSGLKRLILLGIASAILWAIYLTNSRGTWVALFGMLGSWLLIRWGSVRAIIAAAILAPLALVVAPERLGISDDESSQNRIDAWYEGMQMFQSNPILGVGKDQFIEYHHRAAHNSWVVAFSELGFLGYYLWISIMFSSLYCAYWFTTKAAFRESSSGASGELFAQEQRLSKALLYSLIGIFGCMFFISRTYNEFAYLACAMVLAQHHRYLDFHGLKPVPSLTRAMAAVCIGSLAAIYVLVRLKS